MAWSLHRSLSPRVERWALDWAGSGKSEQKSLADISGTEWPLFGSCFYLWATESLQAEHQHAGRAAPLTYARGAVEAATALVIDPRSAGWVRKHWGDRYLTEQNAFYRMLVMSAIVSHHRLTGATKHLPLLRDQVEALVVELDNSPAGLIDDYPGQCYPTDVVALLLAIQRADVILGTDHSAFIQRALRGFVGSNVRDLQLPPYAADARTGRPADRSRGCGNAYLTMNAPELWPQQAERWYAAFAEHFWKQDWWIAGFREFPKDEGVEAYFDVDSGPVINGVGFAASAFGLAAARRNGRFDHAWPLTAMAVSFSWPLPDGTLLVPRVLSNASDAPFLGEAALLFSLSRTPIREVPPAGVTALPAVVWIALLLYFTLGFLFAATGWRRLRARNQQGKQKHAAGVARGVPASD